MQLWLSSKMLQRQYQEQQKYLLLIKLSLTEPNNEPRSCHIRLDDMSRTWSCIEDMLRGIAQYRSFT